MKYSERIAMRKKHNEVRDWLNSLPGMVEADDPTECIRKAAALSGVDNIVFEEFKQVLNAYGFTVEQLGVKHILRLPGRPMPAANNADRLRNIVR